jgi:H+/Cl- antiporter ClcA
LTSLKLGFKDGISITILTWSFFVFCTPIADAGFLIDFPIRLITKLKMVYTEIIVWIVAAIVNVFFFFLNPQIYNSTILLSLFKQILTNPWPFWIIIILSGIGTFLSILFADELMDVKLHKDRKKYHKHVNKYQLLIFTFIIILIIIVYYFLIKKLGIDIPLF